MDSKILNNVKHILLITPQSRRFSCAWLILTLAVFSGCANSGCGYEDNCSTIPCRVKKCFLFHCDKCSPRPYFAFDGYQKHLDKFVVKHAAKKCAHVSLKNLACDCAEKPSKPFRKGYQQAYIDIALGDSGEVPPVPPKKYWAAHYRTPAGYLEIQEWFTGYKLGSEHALADGRFEYNKIATPYSLAAWDQPVSNHWEENSNVYQSDNQPEVNPAYAPPAPMSSPLQIPKAPLPSQVKPAPAPAPVPPSIGPAQTIPQKQLPPPPQPKQHKVPPVLPQQKTHNQRPQIAPKPVQEPQSHSTIKSQRPKIQQPVLPKYRNDDPPPNPYSLQSYPYTPLPNSKPTINQYRR